jgi:hypothetical protein
MVWGDEWKMGTDICFDWIDVTTVTLHLLSAIPVSPLYVLGGCFLIIYRDSASRYYPLTFFTSL